MLLVLFKQEPIQQQVTPVFKGLAHSAFVLEPQALDKLRRERVVGANEARDPWHLENAKRQVEGRIEVAAREPVAVGQCGNVHVNVL